MRCSSIRPVIGMLGLGLAVALSSAAAQLQLESLPKSESEKPWKGHQFVAADRAGHVYFLKADTFEAYPLTKTGLLGEPVELQKAPGLSDEIREAAISPAGDAWLLRVSKGVRLFENGKEKVVPPWRPYQFAHFRTRARWTRCLGFNNSPTIGGARFASGKGRLSPR
jgi:hypothetical protein